MRPPCAGAAASSTATSRPHSTSSMRRRTRTTSAEPCARRTAPRRTSPAPPAIQHDLDPILSSDLRRGEAIAAPIALVVLVAVLGLSFAVAIPFLFAACSIAATLAVVYALAGLIPVVTYVPNLVELLGLGLAIDYSLLVVGRFREETTRGRRGGDAIAATMATAGRAVVFSGVAVAIGLGLLLFMPIPFIRSMGLGGFLIPLASVAAALTLQPALLSLLGHRGTRRLPIAALMRRRGHLPLPMLPGARNVEDGLWARLARSIMRRPVAYLAAGTALLIAAATPVLFLHLTPISVSGLPALAGVAPRLRAPARPGGSGCSHAHARRRRHRRARAGTGADQSAQPSIGSPSGRSTTPSVRDRERRAAPYVDPTGRYAQRDRRGRHEYGRRPSRGSSSAGCDERTHPGGPFPGRRARLRRRRPAPGRRLPQPVLRRLPLAGRSPCSPSPSSRCSRAFRSLVLPLKAVLLNLLSVAAVYGLLVVVFRWGVGSGLLGLHQHAARSRAGSRSSSSPPSSGSRWTTRSSSSCGCGRPGTRSTTTHGRSRHGLERTGRIVTAAAAIMVAAFSGFAVGRVAGAPGARRRPGARRLHRRDARADACSSRR